MRYNYRPPPSYYPNYPQNYYPPQHYHGHYHQFHQPYYNRRPRQGIVHTRCLRLFSAQRIIPKYTSMNNC